MKQFLLILSVILGVGAGICVATAIVISTYGSQNTNIVFIVGVILAALCAIVAMGRSMFYGEFDSSWEQDIV